MKFVGICLSQEIPRVSQTTMRLRLFPLSLIGEATNWFQKMPYDSIKIWTKLKDSFLQWFFKGSKDM